MNYPMSAGDAPRHNDAEISSGAMSHRFPRPGQRPLVFQGSQLAMAMSFTPDIPFWYEINIYRTDSQDFVLVVKQFFQSAHEEDLVKSWRHDTLADVFDALENYDAAQDIHVTFTNSDDRCAAEYAALAFELRAKVQSYRGHWASLVGELFDELDVFAENFSHP